MDREGAGPALFCSFAPLPHHLPKGLPLPHWTSNRGWVPLGVGTPPLSQLPLRGAIPEAQPLLLLPLPCLRTRLAGGVLGGQRIRPEISAGFWGSKWSGETWPHYLLILCPPNGSPFSRLLAWDPFPSPSRPSGVPVPSHLQFSSPFTPSTPHILPGRWGFLPSP